MKQISKKTIIIALSLIALGLLGLKFHIEIKDAVTSLWSQKSAENSTKQSIGVPRQISYLGRIREAETLIEHEYYELAHLEITEAIKQKPELLTPYLLLGELHLRQENTDQLTALLKALKQSFPEDSTVLALQIRQLIMEKNFAQAMNLLKSEQSVIEEDSPHLEFYYALLLALQNDHATAKEIIDRLDRLPSRATQLVVTESGVDETTDGETDSPAVDRSFEKKIFDVAIVYQEFEEFSDGKMPHLFALLSKTLAENNEAHLAREFAETALKEDVEYVDAWVLRGYAELMLQNYEESLLDLKRAYELDPIRPETHYFLALALEKLGQDTEASLFFEKALENEFEFSTDIKWKLIKIFTKQEKYDRVIDLYQEVIEDNPNPKEFVGAMHTSIDILKRPEVALEISQNLLDQNPDDVLAMNLHGWALIANEQYGPADEVLAEALELDDKNPRTFLNFGLLAEKRNEFDDAINYYQQSYELGKEQPFNSVTNLAAERYNKLINTLDRPEAPAAPSREANSP